MISENGHKPITVAVDAMGGDLAPDEIIDGAVQASKRGVSVTLTGPRELIEERLVQRGAKLPIVDAAGVIAMDEPVAQAVRRESSSLRAAIELVTAGDAHAVVSCGNSGAIMALSQMIFGRQAGCRRPAFGGTLPARGGTAFVLDIGANTATNAANLVQFAIMGDTYARVVHGLQQPRVALLSNGTEETKGTKQVRDANEVLSKLDLNFIGNIEGNQVFEGRADVVITDGFTGNVLLKGAEGVALEIFHELKQELSRDVMSRLAAGALSPAFHRIKRRVDFEEYGGVPVLGVNGVMINCHGRSKAKAVANGIELASRMANQRLVERIGEALQGEEVETGGRRRRLVRALHLRHE